MLYKIATKKAKCKPHNIYEDAKYKQWIYPLSCQIFK